MTKRATPKPWKAYQNETARLFKALGCIVETDASVQGVRARHDIDVWIRFARFGVQQAWVIECKLWNRRVPKEKVLALRGVVEDVGADRGILLAESGHQRGARAAATSTNITLTTLEDLRQSAETELMTSGLEAVATRAARLKKRAGALYQVEHSTHDGMSRVSSRPKAGVDGKALMEALGRISVLQMGVDHARLGSFPAPLTFAQDGKVLVSAGSLKEFVSVATKLLGECEDILSRQGPSE